jgi:hypothetical protein
MYRINVLYTLFKRIICTILTYYSHLGVSDEQEPCRHVRVQPLYTYIHHIYTRMYRINVLYTQYKRIICTLSTYYTHLGVCDEQEPCRHVRQQPLYTYIHRIDTCMYRINALYAQYQRIICTISTYYTHLGACDEQEPCRHVREQPLYTYIYRIYTCMYRINVLYTQYKRITYTISRYYTHLGASDE